MHTPEGHRRVKTLIKLVIVLYIVFITNVIFTLTGGEL